MRVRKRRSPLSALAHLPTTLRQRHVWLVLVAVLISQLLLPPPIQGWQDAGPVVNIWLPAALYPAPDTTAMAVLTQHLSRYAEQTGTTIAIRIKRNEGAGGIYATLVNAAVVAPAAIPDLVIMKRSDLLLAVRGALVQPIDTAKLAIDDWITAAIALGVVENVQYGVPYVLELQHMLYIRDMFEQPPVNLSSIYIGKHSYAFPASGVRGVNATFLGQYLAAGGTLSSEGSLRSLGREPLLQALRLYQQAAEDGLIGKTWLNYESTANYLASLMNGNISAGQVDSTTYLSLSTKEAALFGYAPIPDGSGIVDSWLWVLTVREPQQQARAMDVLRYLLDVERMGAFTGHLGMLPARRLALERWATDYAAFAAALLQSSTVPSADMVDPAISTILQSAFEKVITGELSAETATDASLVQLAEQR